MYKQRERQSALKRELEEIDAAISAVVDEIKKAADVKLSPSLGLATLAKSCSYKQQLLTNIAQSLLALKSKVTSTTLLNNLRRRVKQQKATTSEDYNIDCFCTSDFTWEEAYRMLDMTENTGINTFPLDYAALRLVCTLTAHTLSHTHTHTTCTIITTHRHTHTTCTMTLTVYITLPL